MWNLGDGQGWVPVPSSAFTQSAASLEQIQALSNANNSLTLELQQLAAAQADLTQAQSDLVDAQENLTDAQDADSLVDDASVAVTAAINAINVAETYTNSLSSDIHAVLTPTITESTAQDGSVTLTVTAPTGYEPNTWFYQVVTSDPDAQNPYENGTWNTLGAPESFTITGLSNGVTYTVRVAHWNGDVSSYTETTVTPVASATTPVFVPETPYTPVDDAASDLDQAPVDDTEVSEDPAQEETPEEEQQPEPEEESEEAEEEVDSSPEDEPSSDDESQPETEDPEIDTPQDETETSPDTEEQPQEEPEPDQPEEVEEPQSEEEEPVEEQEDDEEPTKPEPPKPEPKPDTTPKDEKVNNLQDALKDGNVSKAEANQLIESITSGSGGELPSSERAVVATVLVAAYASQGGAVPASVMAEAGIEAKDLPPETPVELENGVVIVAEVQAAFEVLADPGELAAAIFSDPGQVLTALSNLGADMSEEEREESQKVVVTSVIATGIAIQAAAQAAASAAVASSSSRSSSSSTRSSSGGDSGLPSGREKGTTRRRSSKAKAKPKAKKPSKKLGRIRRLRRSK
jgi:hypothetical protein